MALKSLVLGIVMGLLLAACAGISFPYKYYGIAAASYTEGKLVGPVAVNDLDFSICEPTAKNARPCIAMLTGDFEAMKQDYLDTKNQLIGCQKIK